MRRAGTAFVGAVGHTGLRTRAAAQISVCNRQTAFCPRYSLPCSHPHHALTPRRTSRNRIYASVKQQETEWNVVNVVENSAACEEHRYIVINVGTTSEKGSLTDTYRVPGMYVQMREGEGAKPGFFALSCGPNVYGIFEFLIKETPSTEWLCKLKAGEKVEMSPVMGKGYPMAKLDLLTYPPIPDAEKPLDILLFATGSGIAPIRAVIESVLNGLNSSQRRSVKLFYGARYAERMAFMNRFALWELDGIEIIPVMSRPSDGGNAWTGRTGYVQDALREVGIPAPAQTAALLCGVKGMTEEVKTMLVEAGVRPDRVLFNF